MKPNIMPGGGPGRHGGPGGHMMMPKAKVKDVRGAVTRLWSYVTAGGYRFTGAVLLVSLTTVLELAAPYLQGVAIDKGIIAGDSEKLLSTILILGAIYLGIGLLTLFQSLLMVEVSQRVVLKLRNEIFNRLQKLSLRYFDRNPHGELMSRVSNDIDLISEALTSNLAQLISGVLSIIGVTVMMLLLNVQLAVIALVTIPLILVLTRFIARYTRKGYKEQQMELGSLNSHVEESVSALQTVKLFCKEGENLNRFTDINERLQKASVKANIFGGLMGPTMNMMRNLNYVVVAFAGGYLAFKGLLSIGLIAAFLQYTRQFSRPINQIAQLYNSLQSALAGAERVFTVIDEIPEINNVANPLKIGNINGEVIFKHVDFSYIRDQPVLKDLSFTVKPCDTVAIVGETGAGKTTIVNLLTRFYDIDKGAILIDGHDIRNFEIDGLRQSLGFVLQDTFLFSDTVRENIRYGKPDASDEEILQAATMANAHHFIHRLPQGYETLLTFENGNNLSEGQKQLLAIARVILSNPTILILDEATSNVDTRTEIHIQEALLNLMKGRTSFVIAHRLSTIRDADTILVLEGGQIVEQGNHQSLMAKGGIYHELYETSVNRLRVNGNLSR